MVAEEWHCANHTIHPVVYTSHPAAAQAFSRHEHRMRELAYNQVVIATTAQQVEHTTIILMLIPRGAGLCNVSSMGSPSLYAFANV